MHPPHPEGATERPKLVDRFADWLLEHCPLSTLTLLTLLVGSALEIPRPWQAFAAVAAGDVAINLIRRRRRARRLLAPAAVRRRAAA